VDWDSSHEKLVASPVVEVEVGLPSCKDEGVVSLVKVEVLLQAYLVGVDLRRIHKWQLCCRRRG
jgi:hypothetical protein